MIWVNILVSLCRILENLIFFIYLLLPIMKYFFKWQIRFREFILTENILTHVKQAISLIPLYALTKNRILNLGLRLFA